MTYQEALKKRIDIKKHGIRQKLHRYNPDRFPDPGHRYSLGEIFEVEMEITFSKENPKFRDIFNRDDVFFKEFNK